MNHPGNEDRRGAVTVRLRRPLERALEQGHPWIYRDSLEAFQAPAGAVATVVDARGRFVARGVVDGTPLALRVFTLRDESLGAGVLAARVDRALELRRRVVPAETDAWRWLHGEGDRLPGFVCDVYGETAVLVCDGAGAEAWRDAVADVLRERMDAVGVKNLLARSGRGEQRTLAVLHGEAPSGVLRVRERGMTLCVDLARGQKTGLFLDQRESRWRVREIARGLRVLNLYGYTGGFSVAAGVGGASRVLTVDVAPGAIELARETWAANALDAARHEAVAADVPEFLARETKRRARYDLVVADPPSFAPREDAVEGALKSYRALHASALALVAPGGWYLAGSCSSHVDQARFTETLLEGAHRAKRVLQVVDRWGAPPDHPRLLAFPEGDYLKNVLARVMD